MPNSEPRPAESAPELLERYAAGERIFSFSSLVGANLKGAQLDGIVLAGSDLKGACLDDASLAQTNLIGASFVETSLKRATITPAALGNADLFRADLEEANLQSAQCRDACLVNANLSRANLVETGFDNALFGFTKLHGTFLAFTHLGEIQYARHPQRGYEMPNEVDTATVERTAVPFRDEILARIEDEDARQWMEKQRHILVRFFENCGITKLALDAAGLLGGVGLRRPSVFISYATEDEEFVRKIERALSNAGITTWFAAHQMRGGVPILDQVTAAISSHDRTLLVLSENSMSSKWVRTEVLAARGTEETTGRRVLFPIRLGSFEDLRNWKLFDADSGTDLAHELRALFIPDFSKWREDNAFEAAVARLIRDLNASSEEG